MNGDEVHYLERIQELQAENDGLRERNRELNIEQMRTLALLSDAEDTIRRWRTELEIVVSKGSHNLCHIWIPDLLKKTLGHTGNFPDPGKMTKEEFRQGCAVFQDDIFGPDKLPVYSGKMFDQRAVFFDRDGTVIESILRPDSDKLVTAPFSEDELKFVPNAYPSLDKLRCLGFLRILITNQPDVAHGYIEQNVWRRIQKKVKDTLGLDDIFMCRHRAEDNCPFKKPSPLMLRSAADKWGIDLNRSWMVGDTDKDIEAGRAAGCRVIIIDRPYNRELGESNYDYRAYNIVEAINFIIDQSK